MEPYEIVEWSGDSWRLIYQSPTRLTDNSEDEELLTSIISSGSKSYPPECEGMIEELARPFRVDRAYPNGSRFRKAGLTHGVYYAAEQLGTAIAEAAFYLILDYVNSKALPFSAHATIRLGMRVPIFAAGSIDISGAKGHAPALNDLTDYTACQSLSERARNGGVELIRFSSVRNLAKGINLAVLSAKCLATKKPIEQQFWSLLINANGVMAKCITTDEVVLFDRDYFSADPRLANFRWDR